ncbi:MAG: mechanosensitive ion channel protein MscS [Planctomyces sp.]|nr:mechanosensitive ion channel protein MscS [Planctomyces sp.]
MPAPALALVSAIQDPEAGAETARLARPVLDSLRDLWMSFLDSVPNYGIALVILILGWANASIASRLLAGVLKRIRMRNSLVDLFRQLSYAGLWIAAILVAAVIAFPEVTIGKILTVLGLGSIAIGFAFKDIFENFFAGVLILWRFPFENGDYIEVEGIFGKVEDISIRMTEIRQTDGQLVVLPNSRLFKNAVTIVTSEPQRRMTIVCGVAYSEDVDAAHDVIRAAVESCKTVSRERPIQVFAKAFGASSIDFEVTWWTGSRPLEQRRSRGEVVAATKRALDDAGIEIPFPYRTLTFKEPLRTVQVQAPDGS